MVEVPDEINGLDHPTLCARVLELQGKLEGYRNALERIERLGSINGIPLTDAAQLPYPLENRSENALHLSR